jgi:predicted RNA polymerase sigma factor
LSRETKTRGGRACDLDGLASEPALKNCHLHKLGRAAEARTAFELASTLATSKRERELLKRRATEAGDGAPQLS